MNTQINQERLKELETIILKAGAHSKEQIERDKEMCVMEAVAYVAGEPGSDQPTCACEFMTRIMQRHNDRWSASGRQLLKPLIPLLVGTRDGRFKERAKIILKGQINRVLPILLNDIGLPDLATEFKTLDVSKKGSAKAAMIRATDEINKLPKGSASASAYASAYACAYADAYADASAYAYASAYACAYADAYADAYASAYAYAYAYLTPEEKKTKREKRRIEIIAATIEALREALILKGGIES